MQFRVAAAINLTHAARADGPDHFVGTEFVSGLHPARLVEPSAAIGDPPTENEDRQSEKKSPDERQTKVRHRREDKEDDPHHFLLHRCSQSILAFFAKHRVVESQLSWRPEHALKADCRKYVRAAGFPPPIWRDASA